MDMIAAWLLFPLGVLVLSLGLGLLIDWAAGRTLPGVLLVPVGFAGLLALGNLMTYSGALAGLATWAVVLLALLGYVSGLTRLRGQVPDPWAAAAAIAVFVVFASPALLAGQPTFSGFLALPDTANQLILGEHVAEAGSIYESQPKSSHQGTVKKYLTTEYPVGPQATLGVLARLGGLEVSWVYQAFLSLMAAMTALALYGVLNPWMPRRWLSAGGAFVAAQPALMVSFALQGSIKELSALASVYLLAALVAAAVQDRWSARAAALPVAVVAAAMLAALGPAALAYIGPFVLVLGVSWLLRWKGVPDRSTVGWIGVGLLVAAVLAIPLVSGLGQAYKVNSGTLSLSADLGNLARPLNWGQVTGVWLNGDFRYVPVDIRYVNFALIGIVGASALLGLGWAVRRRALGPTLLILVLGVVSVYLLRRGSPYADAKVLTIASPAALLAAVLGVAALARLGRPPVEAALLGSVLALGVVGSNAFAYHDVQNAPHERFAELLDINARFAGEGPALLNEYDEYAGYLLRDVRPLNEPEFGHGFRGPPDRHPNGLVDPDHRPSLKTPLDLDDLTNDYVQSLPLIVLRRSPTASRPPATFRRVLAGRYYDVWRRETGQGAMRVLTHLPLGDDVFSPGGVPDCRGVRAAARRARSVDGRLAYVARQAPDSVTPLHPPLPLGWATYGAYPRSVVPTGPGVIERSVRISRGGPIKLWLEGSFARAVRVEIDGRPVGGVSYEPGNPGQYFVVGEVSLTPGLHEVRFVRGGGDLRPGNGGGPQSSASHIGPLIFSTQANERRDVETVRPQEASALCGRSLDWLEVVAGDALP